MAKRTQKKSLKPAPKAPNTESIPVRKTRIRVIGIGGGGGTIISELAQKVEKASFLAANTDIQALKKLNKKVITFSFGQSLTGGLGTGMNYELAQAGAQKEKERIRKLFQGYDLAIIVASLGAGTGSGAAHIFAQAAKNSGLITLGIFTLPFKFEGEKKSEIAKLALQKLRQNLNALCVIPNERIFQVIDKSTPLREALSAINKILAESLEGLIETIFEPGLINIDFADLKTILEGKGRLAFLNTAEIINNEQGEAEVKKVLNSPLYPYNISGAKSILFNISGEKDLTLLDVSQISKHISELVNPEAKIIFGLSQRKNNREKIRVTVLATGLSARIFTDKPKNEEIKEKPNKKKRKSKIRKIKKGKTEKFRKRELVPTTERKKRIKKKLKRIKIKVRSEPREIQLPSKEEEKTLSIFTSENTGPKIRKNGLQIKREAEEAEKEILEKEKFWEIPAFLRREQNKQ